MERSASNQTTIVITPTDRAEILDLIDSYGSTWDAADAEAFARLFTADGFCVVHRKGAARSSVELRGRQALRDAVHSRAGRLRRTGLVTRHCMGATELTGVGPETVRARTGVRVLWQLPDVAPVPRSVQTGYYDSIIVRTAHGWRFRTRKVWLEGVFEIEDVYPDLGR
jgi:hypothetical protein